MAYILYEQLLMKQSQAAVAVQYDDDDIETEDEQIPLCALCDEEGTGCKYCDWEFCSLHRKGHECIQLQLFHISRMN